MKNTDDDKYMPASYHIKKEIDRTVRLLRTDASLGDMIEELINAILYEKGRDHSDD